MKRDNELIRKLLLDLREGKGKTEFTYANKDFQPYPGVDDKTLYYHYELLAERGFIRFNPTKTKTGIFFLEVPLLTDMGHNYAEVFENETVWEKTKEVIKSKGKQVGGVSLEILFTIAKEKAKEFFQS